LRISTPIRNSGSTKPLAPDMGTVTSTVTCVVSARITVGVTATVIDRKPTAASLASVACLLSAAVAPGTMLRREPSVAATTTDALVCERYGRRRRSAPTVNEWGVLKGDEWSWQEKTSAHGDGRRFEVCNI
jgi:hypothetical protein